MKAPNSLDTPPDFVDLVVGPSPFKKQTSRKISSLEVAATTQARSPVPLLPQNQFQASPGVGRPVPEFDYSGMQTAPAHFRFRTSRNRVLSEDKASLEGQMAPTPHPHHPLRAPPLGAFNCLDNTFINFHGQACQMICDEPSENIEPGFFGGSAPAKNLATPASAKSAMPQLQTFRQKSKFSLPSLSDEETLFPRTPHQPGRPDKLESQDQLDSMKISTQNKDSKAKKPRVQPQPRRQRQAKKGKKLTRSPSAKPQSLLKKRHLTGFKRTNDLTYLHEGYDQLEEKLKKVKGLGKACTLESRQKQQIWNQISALKSRLKGREHALTHEGLARRKDQMARTLFSEIGASASRKQLEKIITRLEEEWTAIDLRLNERYPVLIQEDGIYLKGELRPRPFESPQPASTLAEKENQPWPRSKVRGLKALEKNFSSSDHVFKYFQRNGEAE